MTLIGRDSPHRTQGSKGDGNANGAITFRPLVPISVICVISGKVFLPRRPSELPSAEQMQVQMKYGLSCARAYVVDGAIAVFNAAFARDFGGDDLAVAEQFGV